MVSCSDAVLPSCVVLLGPLLASFCSMGTYGTLTIISGGLLWALETGSDGYISGLGRIAASLIPQGRPAVEKWIEEVKRDLAACAKEGR